MYILFTKRVIKFNTGATARFTPRTNNVTSWSASGPFEKRSSAERSARLALGTHTCLAAQVMDAGQMKAVLETSSAFQTDYELENAIRYAMKYLIVK